MMFDTTNKNLLLQAGDFFKSLSSSWVSPWTRCRDSIQHTVRADILINIGPVNSVSIPDNLIVFALFGRRFC